MTNNRTEVARGAAVEREQALFLVFMATGVDARGVELDTDDIKRLLAKSQRSPIQVGNDLVTRGGLRTDHDRHAFATLDQLWQLVRKAKICLVDDRLSMAGAAYLLVDLDSPGLRDILMAYADEKLTRHTHPASSRVTWALRVSTGEDVRDRQLTMAEASFLLSTSHKHLEWSIRTISAIPTVDVPAREVIRMHSDGERSSLPVPTAIAEQVPSDAVFRVEVNPEGVFYRRVR